MAGEPMKQTSSSQTLVKGTFILTIAAVVTKILSAVYRVPFQNIVGDIGFYIYQQVYPFYGIAVVLSTTGFPVVISKLFTEQQENGNEEKSRFLLLVSYFSLQFFGLVCFLSLYLGADKIAIWMNDGELASLIKVVSIVFLTFPLVSVLRGYFQARGDMVPTALSQVGEQTVRIVTILCLASLFIHKGFSLYLVGSGAMVGSITGSIISAIILFMFIWKRKEWKRIVPEKVNLHSYYLEIKEIVKALTVQGFLVCISGLLLIMIQLVDALNLYSLLTASGIEQSMAKGLKGIFDRGQPLIQLGTVAATSMSLAIVPLMTRERLADHTASLHDKIRLAVKLSIVIGAGASFGLWAIIKPTNIMLFENEFGSDILGILSFVILFTSVILTVIAIMQGLGSLLFPAVAVACVFPLKYFLNILLIPIYGTMGAAVSSLITLGLISLVFILRLKQMVGLSLLPFRLLLIVAAATFAMLVFLKAFLFVTGVIFSTHHIGRAGAALEALGAVIGGGFTYLWVIMRGNVFLKDELVLFPFGSRLMYLMSRKD
ncbi:putative polysaccharide biosynthesis protein [Neobacillus paridis]|jgi:O-antigen/teichoic acid export membrane protein|nr:polysaccharide biosynthesis protein [Neobacillus paridis]